MLEIISARLMRYLCLFGGEYMNERKMHELKKRIEYFEQRAAWGETQEARKNLYNKVRELRRQMEGMKK